MSDDDIRRALTRIAHEIIERDKGARRASRWSGSPTEATTSLVGSPRRSTGSRARRSRSGVLDITFYRDDIGLRAEAPEVHETRIGFDVIGQDGRAGRRRAVHGAHDPLRDGRPDGPRPPAQDPARGAGGPRPPRAARSGRTSSARTCRPAGATTCACRSPRSTASTRSPSRPARERTHEQASAVDARPHRRRRRADPGHRRVLPRGRHPCDQEGAGAPRPHGRQLLPRELDADADQLRAGGQAAVGRRDQLQRRAAPAWRRASR